MSSDESVSEEAFTPTTSGTEESQTTERLHDGEDVLPDLSSPLDPGMEEMKTSKDEQHPGFSSQNRRRLVLYALKGKVTLPTTEKMD